MDPRLLKVKGQSSGSGALGGHGDGRWEGDVSPPDPPLPSKVSWTRALLETHGLAWVRGVGSSGWSCLALFCA